MKRFVRAALLIALTVTVHASVVRPAPDFHVDGVRQNAGLRGFRGQTVVLLIARNARDKRLRAELYRLKNIYDQFASEKVIFVAAIQQGPPAVLSDIPFLTASNPTQVAADYGVNGSFAIAVIGRDGNLDMITERVVDGARVRDMIFNNFDTQSAARKGITE